MKPEYQHIIDAAQAGGAVLKNYFGQSLEVTEKSMAADYRTKADVESEQAILKILQEQFPTYNIHAEETGIIDKKSDYSFVVDPLDGTNNFVAGIPYFSTAIALLHNDETVFGVVHNPMVGKTYHGIKGEGAFSDGLNLEVNQISEIKRATVACNFSYASKQANILNIITKLENIEVMRVLRFWSPALDFCLLGSGKIEAIINHGNEIYDFMAGKLIAKEAGATITDFKGETEGSDKNWQFVASSTAAVHQELLAILR